MIHLNRAKSEVHKCSVIFYGQYTYERDVFERDFLLGKVEQIIRELVLMTWHIFPSMLVWLSKTFWWHSSLATEFRRLFASHCALFYFRIVNVYLCNVTLNNILLHHSDCIRPKLPSHWWCKFTLQKHENNDCTTSQNVYKNTPML